MNLKLYSLSWHFKGLNRVGITQNLTFKNMLLLFGIDKTNNLQQSLQKALSCLLQQPPADTLRAMWSCDEKKAYILSLEYIFIC